MLKIATLGAAVALAALSVFGATSAHAQSATSCPGGSDPNARACLFILNPDESQASLIEITEQDALNNPGMMWGIGGLVPTNPAFLHDWIAVTQPGGATSDIVGIPSDGTIAFISSPADFSLFTIVMTVAATSSPIDVSVLLGAGAEGDTAFFQTKVSAVPEPSTWAMLLLGFAGLGYAAMRRKSVRLVNV
jgi:PEP-CTERM motif